MRIHCLENVDKSLNFLAQHKFHLENIGAHDIVDGNPRIILGLLWILILRFQIDDITILERVDGAGPRQRETRRFSRDALLLWCQIKTAGYQNVHIKDFSTSWSNGLALNALIHKHRPDLIDFNRLSPSDPLANLELACHTAETMLNIPRLFDPEDICVEYPDERSIITYVSQYYHYFSKLKSSAVRARRIKHILSQIQDFMDNAKRYENLASNLLAWIRRTIDHLNNRDFAQSLEGVQRQFTSFSKYRTIEKPPRFAEKGNLEIELFTLQNRMRIANMYAFVPIGALSVAKLNEAWEMLEKSEHHRELALREELLRQERLNQLALRFHKKATMRISWILENKKLMVQGNFGSEIISLQAALKKHEALEADVYTYFDRIQAVHLIAAELEKGSYSEISSVLSRRNEVESLWQQLLSIMKERRERLELKIKYQKEFSEANHLLKTIEYLTNRIHSEEGIESDQFASMTDLLQRQEIIEADIRALHHSILLLAEQSNATILRAKTFDTRTISADVVRENENLLQDNYTKLVGLAEARRTRLERMSLRYQILNEVASERNWLEEKINVLQHLGLPHDLNSAERFVRQHHTLQ
ncbi:unnamed protein product, partial [Protopolystoma xenopodis]